MILKNQSNLVSSSFRQEKKFEFNASPQLFRILSDSLYSNKLESIVREIASNCLDAHVEAGKADVPFEITLPTRGFLNSGTHFLVFRDFGNGLSHEDMETIYTTYCLSTKNTSNDFIGAFGIGSKSPFSYTDSFYVTSIHNRTKTRYNAHINNEGYPVLSLIGSENTKEPSGLIVSIPIDINDIEEVTDAVKSQLNRFNVLPHITNEDVDEKQFFEQDTSEMLFETKDFQYFRNKKLNCVAKINISGILYKVDIDVLNSLKIPVILNHKTIINANVGDVDLVASRENIALTKKTEDFIISKFKSIYSYILNELVEKYKKNKWDYCYYLGHDLMPYNSFLDITKAIRDMSLFCGFDSEKEALLRDIKFDIFKFDYVKDIKLFSTIGTYSNNLVDIVSDHPYYHNTYYKKHVYSFTKKRSKKELLERLGDEIQSSYFVFPAKGLKNKADVENYGKIIGLLSLFFQTDIKDGDKLFAVEKEKKKKIKKAMRYRVLDFESVSKQKILTLNDVNYHNCVTDLKSEITDKTVLVKINGNRYITTFFSKMLLQPAHLIFMNEMMILKKDMDIICITETEHNILSKEMDLKKYYIDSYIAKLDEEMKKHKVDLLLASKYDSITCRRTLEFLGESKLKDLVQKNNKCKLFYNAFRSLEAKKKFKCYFSFNNSRPNKTINVRNYIDKNFYFLNIIDQGMAYNLIDIKSYKKTCKKIKKTICDYLEKGEDYE